VTVPQQMFNNKEEQGIKLNSCLTAHGV